MKGPLRGGGGGGDRDRSLLRPDQNPAEPTPTFTKSDVSSSSPVSLIKDIQLKRTQRRKRAEKTGRDIVLPGHHLQVTVEQMEEEEGGGGGAE